VQKERSERKREGSSIRLMGNDRNADTRKKQEHYIEKEDLPGGSHEENKATMRNLSVLKRYP